MAGEMGAVGEAGVDGDVGYLAGGVVEQPAGVAQAERAVELGGAGADDGQEEAFELAGGEVQALRDVGDRQRIRHVLFHQQHGAAHAFVEHCVGHGRVWLGVGAGAGTVEHENMAAFLRDGAADMAFDQEGGEVGGAAAAGAGNTVVIGDEEAVGDGFDFGEFFREILAVIPADAAFSVRHEAGAGQDEAAGAQADQRHAKARSLLQVGDGAVFQLRAGVQKAADDDDVVEIGGVDQVGGAGDLNAAAGADGRLVFAHDGPAAEDLAAAVTLVGGEAELIDEQGEGGKGEVARQDEADVEARRGGLGWADGCFARRGGAHGCWYRSG